VKYISVVTSTGNTHALITSEFPGMNVYYN